MNQASKFKQDQKEFRKKLIKAVHCAPLYKNYYCDHRDVYQLMLKDSYGRHSSTQLSIPQLIDLLNFLNGRTRHPMALARKPKTGIRKGGAIGIITEAQKAKIKVLRNMIRWEKTDGFDRWLEVRMGIAGGLSGVTKDSQANQVIEGLKNMFENQMKEAHGPGWMDKPGHSLMVRRYIGIHYPEKAVGGGR